MLFYLNESQLKPSDAREYLQLCKNEELGKLCKRLATFNGVDVVRKQVEKTPKTLMESTCVEQRLCMNKHYQKIPFPPQCTKIENVDSLRYNAKINFTLLCLLQA
jgi:CHAD domain-containing protein